MPRKTVQGFLHTITLALCLTPFGGAGAVISAIPGGFNPSVGPRFRDAGRIVATTQLADGRICIVGSFTEVNGVPRTNLAVIFPDGTVDPGFASGGPATTERLLAPGTANTPAVRGHSVLAATPDGGVIVSGWADEGTRSGLLWRYDRTGVRDLAFDPSFSAATVSRAASVDQLRVQPDGRILVLGFFSGVDGHSRYLLARLLPTGQVDPSFVPDPSPFLDPMTVFHGLEVQADGKVIVAGGILASANTPSRPILQRLAADGGLDPSWAFSAVVLQGVPTWFYQIVMGIAIQPDQRIVLGFGIGGRVALHRTTPDGSPDPDFNPELTPLSFLRTIVPSHDPKGRLLLEGLTPAGGTESILRINSDGSPDSTFNSSGLSGDRIDEIQGVADGRVLVAGEIDIGSDPALKLAFLERDGSITPLARVTSPGSLAKVIPLPDGKLMVSGRFEEVDGTRLHRLARLNSGGTVDPTFSTRGLVARYVTGSYWFTNLLFDALAPQPGGRLLVGLEGIYPYEVVRLHGDGSVDPSLEPFQADGYGNTLALTLPDGGVIFAGFSVGGYSWGTVHELTPVGAYVPVLIPPYEASYLGLSGLAAQSDGRAVAAISSSGLYRGSPDGTLDRTFRPPFPRDTQFHDLKVDASDRILVAHSASPGLVSLSRLLPNGRVDPSFHPDWLRAPGNTLEPRTLSLLPDGRLFVVAVRTLHGNETAVVLRLRPDGDLDGGFPEIPLEHAPSSQLIDAQGGLLLTGVEPGVISRVAGGDPEPSTPVSESALKERVLYAGSDLSLYMAASGFPSPEYQWFRDGNAIPGATRSLLTVTNVQPGDAGLYTVVLSNPHGTASPAGARVTVIPTVSLATALDGPDLRWSTAPTLDSGSAWVGVLDVSHDGRHSARNIPLEEGGSAPLWIDCPVSGTLSFWWKVSSEAGYDVLQFQLGQRIPIQISGETAWANLSFEVMAGERARWSYLKDGSGSVGSDCGWVDQVVFTPRAAPPIPFKTFTPLPDGRVQLGWLTVPGRPASLEASSNLIDWQVLTNLIGTGLEIPFIDAEAATMPWRFYRVTER